MIRNCSCRGSSGYAHLSCVVNYAENESRQAYKRGEYSSTAAYFRKCPNCKQDYQNEVQYALGKAGVEFVEREYKNSLKLYLDALVYRIYTLDFTDEQHRPEGEDICSKMLSIIEEADNDPSLQHDGLTNTSTIALAHHVMADFHQFGSEENLEKAKKHYDRAKDLYKVVGTEVDVMTMERYISIIDAKLSGNEVGLGAAEEINYWRKNYYDTFKRNGEDDVITINEGIASAIYLSNGNHTIEAERLLTKLVATCRCVHGIEHNVTEEAVSTLEGVKERLVFLGWSAEVFHRALRYESDGDRCVVQGPLPMDGESRNVDEEETFTIPNKDIVSFVGTPVICHGLRLRKSSHLNSKIGDLRSYSEDRNRCVVHFEEEGLEPVEISVGNVRILFDLPTKD